MKAISLEQASRAAALCFMADLPVALWGPVGIGKSSIVKQLTDSLGWKLYDIRLSDKLASDFGAPYPNPKTGKLDFLITSLLPFDTDEKCVVFFDEYDRIQDINVQNMTLQLILDRSLNGHKLSKNARIVLAGNGVTDGGTTPLTSAAATRMVHLYIEGSSQAARDSYLSWAEANGISPMLRSFVRYHTETWRGEDQKAEDLAKPTKRTFDMADRLLGVVETAKFPTVDIVEPIVAGCVSLASAAALLAWRKTWLKAPRIEDIVAEPYKTIVPSSPDVVYSLSLTILGWAMSHEDTATLEALCAYTTRFAGEEQIAFVMRLLEKQQPRSVLTKSYQVWKNKQSS